MSRTKPVSTLTHTLTLALTLACAPTAIAFPPCPKDSAQLSALDQSGAGGSNPSWASAMYGDAGSIAPIPVLLPCEPNFPALSAGYPRTGQCDVDALLLDTLPLQRSDGSVAGMPRYSKSGWIGYIALPELRTPDIDDNGFRYSFAIAVNSTGLAHPGDWVDVAELGFLAGAGTERSTTYRLRKHHSIKEGQVLQVIAMTPASMSGARTGSSAVVATVPLDNGLAYRNVVLSWTASGRSHPDTTTGTVSPLSKMSSLHPVDTRLTIAIDDVPVHAGLHADQMPDSLSMGVLDYNLPYALGTPPKTTTTSPSALGLGTPGRAVVFPTAAFSARAL